MFEAEAQGLHAAGNGYYHSQAQCLGTAARSAYLVLEWLGPWGDPILGGDGALSGSNALSHQQQGFGWKQNNTIGSTPKSIPGQQTG